MAFKWTFMNSDHLEVKHKISILCTTDNNIHSKKNCLIMNVLWITMHYYICQSWYGKLRNYATPAISRQLQIFVTFVINKHIFSIKDDPHLIFFSHIMVYGIFYEKLNIQMNIIRFIEILTALGISQFELDSIYIGNWFDFNLTSYSMLIRVESKWCFTLTKLNCQI